MPNTFTEILLERLAQDKVPPPSALMEAYAPRAGQNEPNLQDIITRHLGEAVAALPKVQESESFEDA